MARIAKIVAAKRTPKFSSRKKSRCEQCGRSKAFYRMFHLCRLCLRKFALKGMIPGVTKASW